MFNNKTIAMRAILKITLTVLLTFAVLLPKAHGQSGWTIQNSGTTKNLNKVYFLNHYTGYTVGDSGTILKTTNGGKNWTISPSGTAKNLRGIYFINYAKGFCAGDSGTYIYTLDSGKTWQDMSFHSQSNLYSVTYTDAYNGFITGDSLIIATFDGGQNWESIYLINSLLAICFPSAATGYAIDNQGGIYKSADGGHNWRRYIIPYSTLPNSVYFTGVSTGYITGASPLNILKTSDGGINWTVSHSGASSLNSVMFTSAGNGFAVGDNGTILKTTNQGVLWYDQTSLTTENLNSVFFKDSLYGTIVGNNGTILTTVTSGEIPSYRILTGTVKYADNENLVTNGWVRAIRYDTTTGHIITVDSSRINPNGEYAIKVPIGDSTDIMAYQDDETADYVPTYYPSTIEWTESLTIFPVENRANVNIKVFRMDTSSTPQGYVSGKVFKNIIRPDDNKLPGSIIYAKIGNIYKGFSVSDSAGKYKVDLPAGNYKIYVKRYGYTNDSTSINIQPPTLEFNSVNFYLEKLSSGVTVTEGTPVYYYLEQNYPNPFNPSTTIEYILGSKTFVKLTIYDIMGREIALLESTEKGAGTYKIDFNAVSLPSGVYFYKLETEDYTSSRPMILLK